MSQEFRFPTRAERAGSARFSDVRVKSNAASSSSTDRCFDQILRRQTADAIKRERADFVIDTSGSVEQTRAQLDKILACLGLATGR